MIYVGVDIGGTKIAYGIFNEARELIAKTRADTDISLSAEAFFSNIADKVLEFAGENGYSKSELAGIGICMPGIITPEGKVALIAMLPKLQGFDAGAYLRSCLKGIRVEIANDSHTAALAECRMGAGKGHRHMVYCPVSTGFASAIIIDGKLFSGSDGAAGESGHTILTPKEGLKCGCGNRGCVCSYAAGAMVPKHIEAWIADGESTIMTELAGPGNPITAYHIKAAYDKGDRMAEKALDHMADYMGLWLFNLYITLNIDCFVFGGGLINFGDALFSRVRKVFDSYCFTDFPVYFKFAELGQDSGLIGALELLF